jgi:hypothetical protein
LLFFPLQEGRSADGVDATMTSDGKQDNADIDAEVGGLELGMSGVYLVDMGPQGRELALTGLGGRYRHWVVDRRPVVRTARTLRQG